MSLIVENVFPFKFLRKWSYTCSPLNQGRIWVFLHARVSPKKSIVLYGQIVKYSIILQAYTKSFSLERSNHNPYTEEKDFYLLLILNII